MGSSGKLYTVIDYKNVLKQLLNTLLYIQNKFNNIIKKAGVMIISITSAYALQIHIYPDLLLSTLYILHRPVLLEELRYSTL